MRFLPWVVVMAAEGKQGGERPPEDVQVEAGGLIVEVLAVEEELLRQDLFLVDAFRIVVDEERLFSPELQLGETRHPGLRDEHLSVERIVQSTKRWSSGRGPTRDISPRTTLKNSVIRRPCTGGGRGRPG